VWSRWGIEKMFIAEASTIHPTTNLISEVERGGEESAPQAYMEIRRGSQRRCQQSYAMESKFVKYF
jgi:hypothetical protein